MAEKGAKKKRVAFTTSNVQKAVERMWGFGGLWYRLCVPDSKQDEIKRQFSRLLQQKQALITYWKDHDPRASWRSLITALDEMREKRVADDIRHLAEPLSDGTLTTSNVCQALASVKNWYSLGYNYGGLDVPGPVCDKIKDNRPNKTEEEKKTEMLVYYLHTMPQASWQTIAGALYYREEVTALEAVKRFLHHAPDPTLTPDNLTRVLAIMADGEWDSFAHYINLPRSERDKIRLQYDSNRDFKLALPHVFISTHPAPSWELVAHALYQAGRYDGSCHRALKYLQQHFPTGRQRSKQIYEQEMLLGFIQLDIDKVVMFGIAGSGKTCALAALLGLDPPDLRCSTPLMKRPIEVVVICVDDLLKWEKKTPKQVQETIAEIIRSRIPVHPEASPTSAHPQAGSQQLPSSTAGKKCPHARREEVSESAVAALSAISPDDMRTSTLLPESDTNFDALLQSSDVEEDFVSLINSSPPSSEPILRQKWTYVIDSGGQPQFQEVMPVFLNGASDFVYVFKAHESLNDRPMIAYFDDSGELVCEPHPSFHTNEETMKQCTRTIRSLTAKNKDIPPPRMLLLATHRDMVAEESLSEVLDSLHKRLREILMPHFKEQIVFCDKSMKDFIFTINAKKPEPKDKKCADAIRRCLSGKKEGSKTVKVPLRWHALHQKLKQIIAGLRKNVLTREQCRRAAESLGIDDESCEEALNLFNGLNMLFYFPGILPHLVFLEPQVVLDKVTELVEENYRMSQGKKDQQPSPKQGDWLKFRDYAQVTKKFLSDFEAHYEPPIFTPKELIQLLKGLLVFAELSEGVWFMPCLLKLVSSVDVELYRISQLGALALHFPDSGPLMGMFCCTVAYLLSPNNTQPCPWKVLQTDTDVPECLTRNVIIFTVSDFPGTVTLIDHFTHFEIHVETHPKKAARLWELAQQAVFTGLKRASETLGYTNNTPVPAIACPATCPTHPATPHPATIDKDRVWKCSKLAKWYGDVAPGSIPWLSPPKTAATPVSGTSSETPSPPKISLDSQPLARQLHILRSSSGQTAKVRDCVAARWNDLAVQLEIPHYEIETIERDSRDCKNAVDKMMYHWLNGSARLPVTWRTLLEALEDAEFTALAADLKTVLESFAK